MVPSFLYPCRLLVESSVLFEYCCWWNQPATFIIISTFTHLPSNRLVFKLCGIWEVESDLISKCNVKWEFDVECTSKVFSDSLVVVVVEVGVQSGRNGSVVKWVKSLRIIWCKVNVRGFVDWSNRSENDWRRFNLHKYVMILDYLVAIHNQFHLILIIFFQVYWWWTSW